METFNCIPDDFVDRDIPTILYKRSKNIGSTICNYKDTVEEVKTNEWKANYSLLPGCDCKDSNFVILIMAIYYYWRSQVYQKQKITQFVMQGSWLQRMLTCQLEAFYD